MPTSNAWKSTWAALDVHWLNSIPIDREIRARTDLPVLLTLIIIYFFPSPLLKRRRGVFRVSDALRDHPCWRVEGGGGGERIFSFLFFIIMGIRLEYAASAGPGSFVILSIGVISQMFFLGDYLLVTAAVLASTEKLPFSPLLLSTFFFFLSHLLFKKHQRHSSLLLYHHYT